MLLSLRDVLLKWLQSLFRRLTNRPNDGGAAFQQGMKVLLRELMLLLQQGNRPGRSEELFSCPQVDLDDTFDCFAHADRNILQPAITQAGQLHERAPVVRRFLQNLSHPAYTLIEVVRDIVDKFLLYARDLL